MDTSEPCSSYTPQFPPTLGSYIYNRYTSQRHDASRDNSQDAQQQSLSLSLTLPLQPQECGVKRKRRRATVDADVGLETGALEPATPDGHPQGLHTCSNCAEPMESLSPDLVTCSGCSKSWHQQCLAPQDLASAADDQDFSCSFCRSESDEDGATDLGAGGQDSDQLRRRVVRKVRKKRLAQLPDGVYPAKPKLVGFFARQASDAERAEYFATKRRTDLINILSFCDQLEPHLLVDLLVSVSKRHPDLPIFDYPDWRCRLPSAAVDVKPSLSAASPRPLGRPRHGHRLNVAKVPRKPKGRRRVQNRTVVVKAPDGEAGQQGQEKVVQVVEVREEEVQDSLPPTWPKAGQGLYAKLLMDKEDDPGAFMVDDNDEEAFSHFMVDPLGKQMVVITACG